MPAEDATHLYRARRRVEFHDTDAAGIMHFASYFTLMEEVEHEYLRHIGLSVMSGDAEGPISWPRVAVRCEYLAAVKFEDELEIELRLARLGEKSLTYRFAFRHAGGLVARGEITAVCCRMRPHEKPQSIRIPEWMRQRLPAARDGGEAPRAEA